MPWGNEGTSFGQTLLQPTIIYVQPLLKLMSMVNVKVGAQTGTPCCSNWMADIWSHRSSSTCSLVPPSSGPIW